MVNLAYDLCVCYQQREVRIMSGQLDKCKVEDFRILCFFKSFLTGVRLSDPNLTVYTTWHKLFDFSMLPLN